MKRIAVFVCAAFCVAVGVRAQTSITTGTIQGMVLDPQGAVVPGAEVEVRNRDTNFKRTFSTGPDGRFVFLQLPPGRYTATITKQGFGTLVQDGINLTVGQAVTLSPTMKVSGTEETVTRSEERRVGKGSR